MNGSVTRLTPAGAAGVAVLRVEGSAAVARLGETFSRNLPARGEVAYGLLQGVGQGSDGPHGTVGEVLDEVLVVRAAPSPDGVEAQEAFEVHVHGSPFLVSEIMGRLDPVEDRALLPGPKPATFRERALAMVPSVPSELGARILLDQAAGAMDRALLALRELPPAKRRASIEELVGRGRARERLFRETTIAIIGPVNAGKSTLFNVLVGADAASVSSEEGTTRDALSERSRLGPWPVRFLDTAGERDLSAAAAAGDARALVEREGQRIGAELARRADLVLRLVAAPDRPVLSTPPGKEVVLLTQAANLLGGDPGRWPPGAISALEAPNHARRVVEAAFCEALGLAASEPLWVPGAAVPFDACAISALDAIAGAAEGLSDVTDTVLDELARSL